MLPRERDQVCDCATREGAASFLTSPLEFEELNSSSKRAKSILAWLPLSNVSLANLDALHWHTQTLVCLVRAKPAAASKKS